MDFDSYSNRLSDLTEFCNEHLNKVNLFNKLNKKDFKLSMNQSK